MCIRDRYKGRPVLYSPNAKDPQKRLVYYRVVELLEQGKSISTIAKDCLLYTSPSPRDYAASRMPSSA
ncbi:hypothetical protein JMUB7512_27940 [Staphylococcus aureus]